MSYLEFKKVDGRRISICNNDGDYLGMLVRMRVGAWMSWVLTDVPSVDVYFSAGCLDELRRKIKNLNLLRGDLI